MSDGLKRLRLGLRLRLRMQKPYASRKSETDGRTRGIWIPKVSDVRQHVTHVGRGNIEPAKEFGKIQIGRNRWELTPAAADIVRAVEGEIGISAEDFATVHFASENHRVGAPGVVGAASVGTQRAPEI